MDETSPILITGGCGFIGSALCRRLAAQGEHIINLDALTYAAMPAAVAALEGTASYHFIKADITDQNALASALKTYRPKAIMHLAAESHVDRSIHLAADFMQTNIIGTYTVLEAARNYRDTLSPAEADRFRMLHISTDEVFGSLGPEGFFSETTRYDPRSPYSASKASSDHLVRAWHHTYGLPVLITNCSNNYGPWQFPEKLVPRMIINAVMGKALPIYGDGKNIRDWLYVDDHAAALQLVLEKGKIGETYCIGGNNERSNVAIVEQICNLVDELSPADRPRAELMTYVEDRKGHDRRYAIDSSKIQHELGWKAQHDFSAGLRKTVAWYLAHKSWWQEHA